MKTLIIFIMLSMTALVLRAQEVTVLDEARLIYAPINAELTQEGDSYVYKVNERANQKFAKDPIGFMKTNFDIEKFIAFTADKKYDAYLVTFKSSNGSLEADFDRNGKLLQTRQEFDDVILPRNLRNEVYSNYKGWNLTKAKYSARTKGEILASAKYKLRLKKGDERQNLKFDATKNDIGIAVN